MSEEALGLERARRDAAAWFERLNHRNVSTQALLDFRVWRRDAMNAVAYRELELAWSNRREPPRGAEIPAPTDAPKHRLLPAYLVGPGNRALKGLVILLLAGSLTAGGVCLESRGRTYRTALGEQRLIALADGSRVRLDTDTVVRVKLGRGTRQVVLDRGQAFFEVAHDPARPFSVKASEATVRALGTQFDVRRESGRVQVTLLEGRVLVRRTDSPSVRGWVLAPGDQIELGPRSAPAAVRRVQTDTVVGWTTGRLVFRDAPFAAALAEVNRYSRKPVILEAPSIARSPVNGSFESGDTEAFVAAACGLYDLRAIRRSDGAVVLRPTNTAD
jgi:transmembrane sensor